MEKLMGEIAEMREEIIDTVQGRSWKGQRKKIGSLKTKKRKKYELWSDVVKKEEKVEDKKEIHLKLLNSKG